jgi:phosphoadenosine phosphosulfate reductase
VGALNAMTTLERPTTPSPEELKAISDRFEQSEPHEILRWAVETYGSGLTMATAFGAEGCALLAMLGEQVPNGRSVHVFNLETGYQFAETLELRERIREKYGIEVAYVRAPESVTEMEARFGGPIYGTDPDECCRIRKVAPLKDALVGYTAWLTAIRRDQTSHRAQADIVEWDPKFNLVKINPLANWSKEDVWTYITINEVPFNPLHDQGYPSIGCWPCTKAVAQGEDDRAGRWSTSAKLECGLHTR